METNEKRFPDLVNLLKSWITWRTEPACVSKAFWMPDDSCMVCYDCDSQFTIFHRRHHCRKCGRVFCAKCTSNFVPVNSYDSDNLREEGELIRVCNFCFKQLETSRNEARPSNQILSPSLSTTSLASTKSSAAGNSSVSTAVSFACSAGACQQTSYVTAPSPCQSIQLETPSEKQDMLIVETSMDSLADKGDCYPTHFGFCLNRSDDDDDDFGTCQWDSEDQRYKNSDEFYGPSEFDESERVYGSNKLHHTEGNIDIQDSGPPDTESTKFHTPLGFNKTEEPGIVNNVECETSTSIYGLDTTDAEPMDFENNQQLWSPPEPEDGEDDRGVIFDDDDDDDATGEWRYMRSFNSFGSGEHRSKDRSSEEQKKAMKNIVDGHFRALISQLLQVANIPICEEDGKENWLDIITSLSWEAATLLKPDTSSGGGMDPGLYVKVKCLACGRRSDSMVLKGVVCKKNVAHRRMPSKIEKPRFLLLGGALEYQRVSNLLSCFDTLLQQEMDHLKMAVAKIDAHHPNLLLVEKSVSRYAQEYLLSKNISLVLNMKRPLLERIARCTGAEIVPSIDHLLSPKLGHCDVFHVEKFLEEHGSAGQGGRKVLKTLMFFEGCPKPLGCTILLKGSSSDELKKVKDVIQYGVFAAYHLALETSFLADEGASFPELPLKSPITVALPDKPSTINQSISTIPGFILPSAETSQSNSDVWASSKSDPSIGLGNHIETGLLASAFSSENHASHAFKSVSTSFSASMCDLPVEKGNNTSNIDGEQNRGPLIPLSLSGKVPSSFFGVTSSHTEGENKACLLKEDKVKYMENDSEVDVHHPVLTSRGLDNVETFEGGRGLDCDMQTDDAKMKEMQHDLPSLVTSHQNNPTSDQFITKEEFPPSPSDHQSILVSLSSRCVWKGTVCERSHLLRIKYYGSFDKPLGRYLRDHLFDKSYRCRSCEMPSEAHIYCYTHRQGSLTISVRKLQDIHLPGERDGKIWMWHRCLRCPRVNGLPPAIRRVVMSDAAWGLSLGKFLELSFSNHAAASRVASCGHSLHRDCLRFYGCGEMVACFKYAPINVHSVYLPPSKLDFNYQHQEWVQEEVDKVSSTARELFTQVQKSLHLLEEKVSKNGSHDGNMKVPELRRNLIQLEGILQKEQAEFEESLQTLTRREEMNMQLFVDILEVNKLQKQLLLQAYVWDKRLIKYAAGAFSNPRELLNGLSTRNKEDLTHRLLRSFTNSDTSVSAASELINATGTKDGHDQHKQPSTNHQKPDVDRDKDTKSLSTSGASDQFDSVESESDMPRVLSDGQFPNMADLSDTLDAKWRGENGPTLVDASILKSIDAAASAVSASEISEENSRMDLNSNFASAMRAKSGEFAEDISVLINKPFSELYACLMKNCDSALVEYHPQFILLFKELIQKGWGRLLLPLGVYDTVIPIYDEEPTSVISYALACPEYHLQISDELEKFKDSRESSVHMPMQESGNSSIFLSLEDASLESLRSFGSLEDGVSVPSISGSKSSVILDQLLSNKSQHVRVSFAQRYNVTCYYAKHFDALRKNCCPSELDFIRSLGRCKKWGAQGGKSNVFFAKSLDDRFIIKQVTKTELESFIKFAPEYFKYLSESINTGSPTCLAKILGIYQVSIKSMKGGKETKMDVLVMENLLFRRNVKWLYDLKGSARSRYNADSSGTNKVLLDQNLIEAMPTSPIFVGNKAKRLLERAVWNDTAFLASIDVMDYSLLVGVDENKQELVLGIIDFMRQYTWDKHLETWVKASGFLGGPRDASPTVISPKQYKKRFRKAMSAYFLVVPDQWSPATIVPSRSQSQSDLGEDNNNNNNNNLQGGSANW